MSLHIFMFAVTYLFRTYHFWQVDRGDELPLGPPELMMSLTRDGQIHPDIVQGRDERFGIDSRQLKEYRNGIVSPTIPADADVGLSN